MSPGMWGLLTGAALGAVGTFVALSWIWSYPREDERERMLEEELVAKKRARLNALRGDDIYGVGSDARPDVWRHR